MKKIINKPHQFFFVLIPIVLLLGYIFNESFLDLEISYTYFKVSYSKLSYFFAVFFGLIGLNYFSLYWGNKTPIKWMTSSHIILQFIALVLFFSKDYWKWATENEASTTMNIASDYSNLILVISILIFIISMFIHLINFFVSLINKSK